MNVFIVLAFLVTGVVIYCVHQIMIERTQFEPDEHNPYRRRCKECGQQWELYEGPNSLWWEPMGAKIINERCKCHDFD